MRNGAAATQEGARGQGELGFPLPQICQGWELEVAGLPDLKKKPAGGPLIKRRSH